jgi:hypothetical protein
MADTLAAQCVQERINWSGPGGSLHNGECMRGAGGESWGSSLLFAMFASNETL